MKYGPVIVALGTAAAITLAGSALAGKPDKKGNDLPFVDMSNSWSLVIHSKPFGKCPTAGFDDTNRRSLVVEGLVGWDGVSNPHGNKEPDIADYNDILLSSNTSLDEFQVVDGNACDDDPAELSLPIAVAQDYDLYIKLLGKPGESTAASLCGDLALDASEDYVCNVGSVKLRIRGNNPYVDVTNELLYLDTGGDCGTIALFDACAENYFWDWSTTNWAKSRIVFVPSAD